MAMFINPTTSGSANLVLHLDATNFLSANSARFGDRWESLANTQAYFTGASLYGTGVAPFLDYSGDYGNTRSYFTFNGNDENAGSIGRSNQRAMQTNFTLEIICRFHTAFDTNVPLLEKQNASNDGWALRANNTINGGAPGIELITFNGGNKAGVASSNVGLGDWYYVQGIVSGSSSNPYLSLWVNGRHEAYEQVGQAVNSTTPGYLTIASLGGEGTPPSSPWSNVDINMIRVYDKALSNTEAQQNWRAFRMRVGPPEANGMVSWET